MTKGNREVKLFTPGPLTTSPTVKQAMLREIYPLEKEFVDMTDFAQTSLLKIAEVSPNDWSAQQLQGPGTYAVETVLRAAVPCGGKCLIFANGFYGYRLQEVCDYSEVNAETIRFPEERGMCVKEIEKALQEHTEQISLVTIVHHETTQGVLNDGQEIGRLVRKYHPEALYFLDAMSSFAVFPIDLEAGCVDFVVSSANKGIQGVPGFAFVLSRNTALQKCKGNARSWALDLPAHRDMYKQMHWFRVTAPLHVHFAFNQALKEYFAEGGLPGRAKRFKENTKVLQAGMRRLGFKRFVCDEDQGYVVSAYHHPIHPNFNFAKFCDELLEHGICIFRLKITTANIMRIGTIGHLFPNDFEYFVESVEAVLKDMNVPIPVPYDTSLTNGTHNSNEGTVTYLVKPKVKA